MGERCTGHCCESFGFYLDNHDPTDPESVRERLRASAGPENAQIADMIVPLRPINVGDLIPSGELASMPGYLFTCKNFDTATRSCTIYETRPAMCRDFPYTRPCPYKACDWTAGRRGDYPPNRTKNRLHAYANGQHVSPRAALPVLQDGWGPSLPRMRVVSGTIDDAPVPDGPAT